MPTIDSANRDNARRAIKTREQGEARIRSVTTAVTTASVITAGAPELTEGFHGFEPTQRLQWTDGDAAFPVSMLAGLTGPFVLMVHRKGTTRLFSYCLITVQGLIRKLERDGRLYIMHHGEGTA